MQIEGAGAGCALTLKGSLGAGGDAVLCSPSRTYAMKRVETSNTVCLSPPLFRLSGDSSDAESCIHITEVKHDYYEVRCPLRSIFIFQMLKICDEFQLSVIAPRLSGLKDLLGAHCAMDV